MQYNYILVIGDEEVKNGTVNVRTRDGDVMGESQIEDFALVQSNMKSFNEHSAWKKL